MVTTYHLKYFRFFCIGVLIGFSMPMVAMDLSALNVLATAAERFEKDNQPVEKHAQKSDKPAKKHCIVGRQAVTLTIKCPGVVETQLSFTATAAELLIPSVCNETFEVSGITREAVEAFYTLLVLHFVQPQQEYLEKQPTALLEQLIRILRVVKFKSYAHELADFGQLVLESRSGVSDANIRLTVERRKDESDQQKNGVSLTFFCNTSSGRQEQKILMPCRLAGQLCKLFSADERNRGKNGKSIIYELSHVPANIGLTFLKTLCSSKQGGRMVLNYGLSSEEIAALIEIYRHFEVEKHSRRLVWLLRCCAVGPVPGVADKMVTLSPSQSDEQPVPHEEVANDQEESRKRPAERPLERGDASKRRVVL